MTHLLLSRLIFAGGLIHFSILIASGLVPFRLNWLGYRLPTVLFATLAIIYGWAAFGIVH